MFKSSENLRLAAAMRALQRVAAPWREARRSWFDGTPESIEARLAATDKVLTHARSGFTAAHLALTREAAAARRELLAAKHRLLTDFLDDGARAFKGSRRVAVGNAEWQARQESELDPEMRGNYYDGPSSDDCRHCGERIQERSDGSYGHVLGEDPYTGDTTFYPEDHPAEPDDEDYHTAARRVASDFGPEMIDCPHCRRASDLADYGSATFCPVCGRNNPELNPRRDYSLDSDDDIRYANRRTAAVADFDDQLLFDS